MTLHIIAFVVSSLVVAACTSTEHSTFLNRGKNKGKAIRVDEPIFEIKAVKLQDSTVRLSFVGTPTLRTNGRVIRHVEAAIGPTENELNDIIVFSTSNAGAPGVNQTVSIVGSASWDTRPARKSTECVVDVGVLTAEEHLIYRQRLKYEAADPMELSPFTQAVSDTLIEIGAIARRMFVPTGEHLPSSENLRVIISDAKGNVVWRSDAGQAFLSLMSSVEPQITGQMQRYTMPWLGRDLQGNRVPDGTYKAEVIIPARPNPYRTSIDVPWPPK